MEEYHEKKKSVFDLDRGVKVFESLLNNRVFALTLLFSSLVALFASLIVFNGITVLSQSNPFESADIYKISLFAKGISPYSTEPWAAPYPPFYFFLWSVPYEILSNGFHFSLADIFTAFRIISAVAFCACTYLIYKSQRIVDCGFSLAQAISTSSIFLLCALVAIIYPVGDALGLLLLAGACTIFAMKKATWFGVLLVSLAVAFKIHPILGAILLLAYHYSQKSSLGQTFSKQFRSSFVAFLGVMGALVLVPILVIPDAISSLVLYDAGSIQHYTFNVYAALYDISLNIAPANLLFSDGIDALWLVLSVLVVIYLTRSLFAKSSFLKGSISLYALDLLSLGILAWLLVLKQTMPHYFLWALVPLIARGRTRSLYYVLAAEFFGMIFFGLAQALTTNFFSITGALATVPGLGVSLLLLAGGALFDLFTILAMKELISEMKKESPTVSEKARVEHPKLLV